MANVDVNRIAGNIGALNSLSSLQSINNQLAIHQTRLATGKRLNEAADDPAGMNMAITFDIRRNDMKTVLSTIGDSKNLLSTAEGGLRKISDILVKMKNKALEAMGDTIGDNERTAIAAQLNQFSHEINDTVAATQWNGTDLLKTNGTLKLLTGVKGDGTGSTTDFTFTQNGYTSNSLGLKDVDNEGGGGAATYALSDLSTANVKANVIDKVNTAIGNVKTGITETGTMSARLTFKEDSMMTAYNNTESAYNRIMNADMASEQVEASKYSILQQTATAMLSQANAAPQFLLSLFR
jgi:flagellin